MRRPRRLPVVLLVLASWALVPERLDGQGTVRGVVFDSLTARRLVVNGLVTIEGTGLSARTDALGRFEIEGVPAGAHRLTHHGPWLDSLSLPPLTAEVLVRDGRVTRAELATPGPRAYHLATCGAQFEGTRGVLRGAVRDANGAPVGGLFVGAVWSETIVRRQGMASELVGSIDTTDAAGGYALCGVPRETNFTLRAGNDEYGTDLLAVGIGSAFVARRDLRVSDRTARSQVRGRVVNARGGPLGNAVVTVPGDSSLSTRSDEAGNFVISGVARRTGAIVVRTIGFIPEQVVIEPSDGELELPDVVLQVVPQDLDTVRINAAKTLRELEFLERARSGTGIFLDEAELKRFPILSANVLQTVGLGLRSSGGRHPQLLLRFGMDRCQPRFYVDGIDFGRTVDGIEEQMLLRDAKRIEIHNVAFMPAQYTDLDGCGVVLIWTK